MEKLHSFLSILSCVSFLYLGGCNNGMEEDGCLDGDGDGYGEGCDKGGDCDDDNPSVYEGAEEICDSLDNDCDRDVDNRDADSDGFIDVECGGGDCDDGDASVNPDASETCNSVDDDCNGEVNEGGVCEFTFGPSLQLNEFNFGTVNPEMAIGPEGEVYVIFKELSHDYDRISITKSLDRGETFTTPVPVTDDEDGPYYWGSHAIAIDSDGNIYVVWEDIRTSFHIYLRKSTDGGETFSEEVQVDSVSENGLNTSIAVSPEGALYVSWSGYSGSPYDVYVAESIDGGSSFEDAVQVNTDPYQEDVTDVEVMDDGRVAVAWTGWDTEATFGECNVYFAMSEDGVTFSSPVMVNDEEESAMNYSLNMAGDGEEVYLTWMDVRDDPYGDVFFDRSSAGGRTFRDDVMVNDVTLSYQEDPILALDLFGNILVAWQDWRADHYLIDADIYFTLSYDGGETFLPNVKVNTEDLSDQNNPALGVSPEGERVYVAWRDASANSNFDIYFALGE